jgi:hypothetical protein
MLSWIGENKALVSWVVGAGIGLAVLTLVLVPVMLVRIPADYFAHATRPRLERRAGAWRLALRVLKNGVGVVLIVAGLAMLVLPGQGLLTVLVGFFMLDIPGKYRVEKWIVSRPRVLGAINWLRRKAGREPLRVHGVEDRAGLKKAAATGA